MNPRRRIALFCALAVLGAPVGAEPAGGGPAFEPGVGLSYGVIDSTRYAPTATTDFPPPLLHLRFFPEAAGSLALSPSFRAGARIQLKEMQGTGVGKNGADDEFYSGLEVPLTAFLRVTPGPGWGISPFLGWTLALPSSGGGGWTGGLRLSWNGLFFEGASVLNPSRHARPDLWLGLGFALVIDETFQFPSFSLPVEE